MDSFLYGCIQTEINKDLLNMDLLDFFEELERNLRKNPSSIRAALETAYHRGRWEVLIDWAETVNERYKRYYQ